MGEQHLDLVVFIGTEGNWQPNRHFNWSCSSWLLEKYKNDRSDFVFDFKRQFSSQKTAYYSQVKAQVWTEKEKENVRLDALKAQQLVGKGRCNESAAGNNLECNEAFTRGLPKKLGNCAHKRRVKHTSTVMELPFQFRHLFKFVDAEDLTSEKVRNLQLSLEKNNVTSKLESQNLNSEVYDSNPEFMFTRKKFLKNKSKPLLSENVQIC